MNEALRLAEDMERPMYPHYNPQAAAELRRLHQFAEDQIGRATAAEAALQMTKATHALKIAAVEAQRDEARRTARQAHEMGTQVVAQRDALLEALRTLLSYAFTLEMRLLDADGEHRAMQKARAAIAAVEGENHAKNL